MPEANVSSGEHETPTREPVLTLTKTSMVTVSGSLIVSIIGVSMWLTSLHSDMQSAMERNTDANRAQAAAQREASVAIRELAKSHSDHERRIFLIEQTRYTSRNAREDRDRMIAMQAQMVALTRELSQLRIVITELSKEK